MKWKINVMFKNRNVQIEYAVFFWSNMWKVGRKWSLKIEQYGIYKICYNEFVMIIKGEIIMAKKIIYPLLIGAGVGLIGSFLYGDFTTPIKIGGVVLSLCILISGMIFNYRSNHKNK